MISIIFLYFSLISDVSPVDGLTHAVIGNYSNSLLNSNDCGITGLSPPADSSCFELITLILTFCGLIYQALIIYDQYMSGKTVIKLEIGGLIEESPPAVTISYNRLYSMERAAQFEPAFKEINKTYWELKRNGSDLLFDLYSDSFNNYTLNHLKNNGLDMNELFDKMSIKFKALDGTKMIKLIFREKTKNNSEHGDLKVTFGKTYNSYEYIGEPLETIVFRQSANDLKSIDLTKCLTFFSHTQQQWRHFHGQLKIISIHSGNHLPEFEINVAFREIDIMQEITIKYSEHRIHRLVKSYDTDCYHYELDNNFSYYRMRSDCVNDCYQDKMREICKVDHGIFMSHSLIRKEYLMNGNERLISC